MRDSMPKDDVPFTLMNSKYSYSNSQRHRGSISATFDDVLSDYGGEGDAETAMGQLTKVVKMHQEGTISSEEFRRMKAKILTQSVNKSLQ